MRHLLRVLIRVGLALLLLLPLSAPAWHAPPAWAAPAQQTGALEPNNSFGAATPIAASSSVQESIFPRYDVDWYRLVVYRHGELAVTITNVAPELDIWVRVHNADAQVIGAWTGPLAKGGDTTGIFDLPAEGRYFLEVRDGSDDAEATQAYQLTTVFTPAVDAAEPNNTLGSATPLVLSTPVQGTILPRWDIDWYEVTLDHHGELQFAVTNVPADMEMLARVWNANFSAISDWYAPLAKGGDTTGRFDIPAPGRYYLEVRDKDDNARSTQPYTIKVDFTPAADPFEPNGEFAQATPLSFGQPVHANILPRGDADWFVFSVERQGELRMQIAEVDKELDMVFRVYNADYQAISNWYAPLAKGGNTEGTFDLPSGGRYYLLVSDGNNDARAIQPYRLTLDFVPTVDPFEPNNSFGHAADLGTDRTVQATILPQRDADWYTLQVPHHGELQVEAANVPANLDIVFRLWNADVQAITSWYGPLAKGGNTNAVIDIAAPGSYVLEVHDGNDDDRSVQSFSLTTRFLPAADTHEPNQTWDTATSSALDTTLVGNILPVRDGDWYAFDVPAAGDLHILVTNVAPEMDIVVRLWNASQNTVSSWLGPLAKGGNTDAVIPVAEAGRYVLEVRDGNEDARSIQPYLLRVSLSPIDPATMTLPTAAAPTGGQPVPPPPPGPGGATPPSDGQATTAAPASGETPQGLVRVSGQVGPLGGELFVQEPTNLAVDGARLEVPPDLLDQMVTIHIATIEAAPAAAPFGLFAAGPLWDFTPTGLQFKGPVTITLPAPPSAASGPLFIGHWNGSAWEDLGGTVQDGLITAQTSGFSPFGVFCGKLTDYRPLQIRNNSTSPSINLTYIGGPVPDPADPDSAALGCPPPAVVSHQWDVGSDDVAAYLLRAGWYHLVVSYPQPQPGVANSLFLKIVPGEGPVILNITDSGAESSDPAIEVNFPGKQVVAGTNQRPTVTGTALVPEGVTLASADPGAPTLPSHIVTVGPVKLEQFPPKGIGITLTATASDPEGKNLSIYWTVNDRFGQRVIAGDAIASGATVEDVVNFQPTYAGDYTIFLTVYDDLGLFDEMRWVIQVTANARPEIKVVSGRYFVEFGRLDDERMGGVGAIAPVSPTLRPGTAVPVMIGSLSAPGTPVAWAPQTLCPSVLFGPFSSLPADPESVVIAPTLVDALLPTAGADVTPRWVNPGRTCVWSLLYDADNDPLRVNWEMPVPLYGEGTIYAAVAVPAGFHAKAADGISLGALLDTYSELEAYNAWVAALFNEAGVIPAIVWEAWDDPCLSGDGGMITPCPSAISRGGTTNVVARTTDGYTLPPRTGYQTIVVGPEAVSPDCSHVMFFSELRPTPSDPGPGEDVIVKAVITPRAEACPINFSIVGTDGYANSAQIWTNKNGEAEFFIPGGAEAVVDDVRATVCVPLSSQENTPSAETSCTTADGRPGKLLIIEVTYIF